MAFAAAFPPFVALCPSPARATTVPTDFVVENAAVGLPFIVPVAIAFLPDGRLLIAEKRGMVWMVENGVRKPAPVWDGRTEVLDNNDRGLLDVAVDPHYFLNHYLYLLYTADPDSNNNDSDDDAYGRVTRYQIGFEDSLYVDPASRKVLIGNTWHTGFPSGSPSHSVGSLRFGADGSLLISCGDGAQFNTADHGGLDPGLFLPGRFDSADDIGAFRSRWVGSLAGKVLRVDPETGLGLPSNPFYDGDPAANRARIWAYGMRNPFRFTVRPGTGSADPALGEPGSLFIGDVGWGTWEEVNIARTGGFNFGWPCHEGPVLDPFYPLETPSHGGCDSIGTFGNPASDSPPVAYWHHTDSTLSSPSGIIGNTSIGGAFYNGSIYPPVYRGRYFFGDFGQGWIRTLLVDSLDHVVANEPFATDMDGPVDLEVDPLTGDLVYVAIFFNEIRRIRYVGTENDLPPIARATAYPEAGPAPLTVSFSAATSTDPEGDPLSYNWLFGDGKGSTERDPHHTYPYQGVYQAVLSVSDGRGGIGRDTLEIVADITGFPTTPVQDAFNRPDGALFKGWIDELGSLQIEGGQLTATGTVGDAIWTRNSYGPDQEVYFTLATPSTAPGACHDLYLEVLGDSRDAGCVRARYDSWVGEVRIDSYTPEEGWQLRGGPVPAIVLPGDQIGAKVSPNGTVVVYRNGEGLAIGSVAGTTLEGLGGRIGVGMENAPGAMFDNFGGGNYVSPNTPPEVAVVSPLDHAFFVTGDSLWMRCAAADLQDSPAALSYLWTVDLHHNNHVHPAIFTSTDSTAVLVAENHSDGTGVWYHATVRVTDQGGLSDTAAVSLYPEVDLWPSPPTSSPREPGTGWPATYRFVLHNAGRMPAPITHWRLRAGAAILAEGDTVVGALDSVVVQRALPPVLYEGSYTLRATADTLGAAIETDEANNGAASPLTVIEGAGSDDVPPTITYGPVLVPTGVNAHLWWKTSEKCWALIEWGAGYALGDTMTVPPDTSQKAVIQGLSMGVLYYYRLTVFDLFGNPTATPIDSFTTVTGALDTPDLPLRFALSGARPNPARGRVALALDLPQRARVGMRVLDVAGREVWRAPERAWEAGRRSLEWPGAGAAPPGLYLARVTVDGRAYVRRIVVLK